MKVYGINCVTPNEFKNGCYFYGDDLYSDVWDFAKHVEDFLDDYDGINNMDPLHEYHNRDELVELLESFDCFTYFYMDKCLTKSIIIYVYNVL